MSRHPGAILRHIERLYDRGTATGLAEPALLARFVSERDESAFTAMVARHGPMVLGVCKRILRDERDVEDAFQATFLIFVRRAHVIRDPSRLGAWLHGVAHRVAVRARTNAAKRHEREASLDVVGEPRVAVTVFDPERTELAAILDSELTRLPARLRAPIILCYLEGLTQDEAAQRLRWPVGTVRSRIARARTLLRQRLARRGVCPHASAIVAILARQPLSTSLIERTVQASLALGSSKLFAPAIAAIPAAVLAKGVLQTMFVTKASTMALVAVCGVLAVGGGQTLARQLFSTHGEAAAVQPAPERREPKSDDDRDFENREKRLVSSIEKLHSDAIASKAKAEEAENKMKEAQNELKTLRQTQARTREAAKASQPASGSGNVLHAKKRAEDEDAPDFVRDGNTTVTLSTNGRTISVFDHNKGTVQASDLPPVKGDRRRLMEIRRPWAILQDVSIVKEPVEDNEQITRLESKKATLDHRISAANDDEDVLERLRKQSQLADGRIRSLKKRLPQPTTNRLAAFNLNSNRWIAEDFEKPETQKLVDPNPAEANLTGWNSPCYQFGSRIYAFSREALRWGILEVSEGLHARERAQALGNFTPPSFVFFNHLYVFNQSTAHWEDLSERAENLHPAPPAAKATTTQ